MPRKPPSYRRRSPSSDRAIVTLSDTKTHRRRTYALGVYDSPSSREAYHRLIAAWESGGRRLPGLEEDRSAQGCVTVTELCLAYWRDCKDRYEPQSLFTHREAVHLIRKYHGSELADSFGPNKLRALREVMVRDREWTIVGHFNAPNTVMNAEIWLPLKDLQIATNRQPSRSCVILTLEEGTFVDADLFAKAVSILRSLRCVSETTTHRSRLSTARSAS